MPTRTAWEEIRTAVAEAHAAGRKVAVHVYGGVAADNVIAGGADSIEHGFDLTDDQLKLMKQKDMFLVGTDLSAGAPGSVLGGMVPQLDAQKTADNTIRRLASANRIGVKMAFGSDVVTELPGEKPGRHDVRLSAHMEEGPACPRPPS